MKLRTLIGAAVAGLLASAAGAQENLTAETAGASGVPGTVTLHLGEAAAAAWVPGNLLDEGVSACARKRLM